MSQPTKQVTFTPPETETTDSVSPRPANRPSSRPAPRCTGDHLDSPFYSIVEALLPHYFSLGRSTIFPAIVQPSTELHVKEFKKKIGGKKVNRFTITLMEQQCNFTEREYDCCNFLLLRCDTCLRAFTSLRNLKHHLQGPRHRCLYEARMESEDELAYDPDDDDPASLMRFFPLLSEDDYWSTFNEYVEKYPDDEIARTGRDSEVIQLLFELQKACPSAEAHITTPVLQEADPSPAAPPTESFPVAEEMSCTVLSYSVPPEATFSPVRSTTAPRHSTSPSGAAHNYAPLQFRPGPLLPLPRSLLPPLLPSPHPLILSPARAATASRRNTAATRSGPSTPVSVDRAATAGVAPSSRLHRPRSWPSSRRPSFSLLSPGGISGSPLSSTRSVTSVPSPAFVSSRVVSDSSVSVCPVSACTPSMGAAPARGAPPLSVPNISLSVSDPLSTPVPLSVPQSFVPHVFSPRPGLISSPPRQQQQQTMPPMVQGTSSSDHATPRKFNVATSSNRNQDQHETFPSLVSPSSPASPSSLLSPSLQYASPQPAVHQQHRHRSQHPGSPKIDGPSPANFAIASSCRSPELSVVSSLSELPLASVSSSDLLSSPQNSMSVFLSSLLPAVLQSCLLSYPFWPLTVSCASPSTVVISSPKRELVSLQLPLAIF
jgi:hypothetical protein